MILIIGDHRVAILFTTEQKIPRNEWRLIRNKEQLRGYDPDNQPEVLCVGYWEQLPRYVELHREAVRLGMNPRSVLL